MKRSNESTHSTHLLLPLPSFLSLDPPCSATLINPPLPAAKISPGADDDESTNGCVTMNVDPVDESTDQEPQISTSPPPFLTVAGNRSITAATASDVFDIDVEAVTDVSSTSSETGNASCLDDDDELDVLDGTDLGAFLLDTFVHDDVIAYDNITPQDASASSSSTDMADVATAAMLMVDMPELYLV